MVYQNIEPKVVGLPCEIQVINHAGHGVLTTYDPEVVDSVTVATEELSKFFDDCISEFKSRNPKTKLTPIVCGNRHGTATDENEVLDIKAPDFDLSLFRTVTIMPVPLVGG